MRIHLSTSVFVSSKTRTMLKLLISFAFLAVLGPLIAKACGPDEICPIPYTEEMKNGILKYHNDVRSKVKPTAKDMQKMIWNVKLAEMALEYSKKCVFAHNTRAERAFDEQLHRRMSGSLGPEADGHWNVGQNIFGGSAKPTSFTNPAKSWHNEVRFFKYGHGSKKVVGHYTQMVNSKAAQIGCGAAYCPKEKLKYIVTCHYLIGQYGKKKPYKKGKPCGACPGKCTDNLCDCGGKVCQYGAKLNLKNCECKCRGRTSGNYCEKVACDKKDGKRCAGAKQKCASVNIRTKCVHTCGLCPSK